MLQWKTAFNSTRVEKGSHGKSGSDTL